MELLKSSLTPRRVQDKILPPLIRKGPFSSANIYDISQGEGKLDSDHTLIDKACVPLSYQVVGF